MASKLTRRLSASDAAFLYFERPNAPLHIGSIGIYEGRIPFDHFAAHIDSRMPLIPRYRQRVAFVPFNLAHPTWEDDPAFNIHNHVKLASLPAPGDRQQLAELTGRLFAQPLDRGKPLWEMYVVHGLEGGHTAIVSKVHHCMVDGVSGIELLLAVVDISPEPAPPPASEPWRPGPLPGATARLSEAFWDGLDWQRALWQDALETVIDPRTRLRQLQDAARAFRTAFPWLIRPAPRMPWSGRIGRERRVAFSEMSFPEIREIRTSLGGTVNDVVLAVLTGALRRYLLSRGQRVEGRDLRVAVPVNVRLEDEGRALGNRIAAMIPTLPLGEPDPATRFRLIKEQVDLLKSENHAGTVELLLRLVAMLPVPVQALGAVANTMINLVCTNVPGPMIPLYSVGHLMLAHYPLVPLSMDMRLGAGVTSYNQRLYFGLMADPGAVPDVDDLGRLLSESFVELRNAAGVPVSDLPSINGQGVSFGTFGLAQPAVVEQSR